MTVSITPGLNSSELVRLALSKKKGGTSTLIQKPQWMKSDGSIFAAGPNALNTSNQTVRLNTQKSVNDMQSSIFNTTLPKKTASGSPKENNPAGKYSNIDNAADGKAAANEVSKQKDNVKELTKQTESSTQTMKLYASQSSKLKGNIDSDKGTFEAAIKQEQSTITSNRNGIRQETNNLNQNQSEFDQMSQELNSLLNADKTGVGKSSAFSLSIGNAVNEFGPQDNSDNDRIQILQKQLGTKIQLMNRSSKQIYTLQKNSSRAITNMNKMSTTFVQTNSNYQTQMKDNETTAQKAIKVADTIEQVSGLVAQTGQALNYAGLSLVALGGALTAFPGAGQALIATGKVMQKIGKIAENVGQYGQTAAGITKMAGYAAEGNITAAFASAASAVSIGASAIGNSANMANSLDAINKQADSATKKLAANVAAKKVIDEKTNGMSRKAAKEALGGLSKREARKETAASLQKQMSKADIHSYKGALTAAGNKADNTLNNVTAKATQTATQNAGKTVGKNVKKFTFDKKAIEKMQKLGNNIQALGSTLGRIMPAQNNVVQYASYHDTTLSPTAIALIQRNNKYRNGVSQYLARKYA